VAVGRRREARGERNEQGAVSRMRRGGGGGKETWECMPGCTGQKVRLYRIKIL
jgi:hypothetical protein